MDSVSLALLAFISAFGLSVVSPALPLYVAQFGVSYTAIGGFFSAYSLTWALLQIYTGHLSDRHGHRRFILAGLLSYGLAALGCALARSFGELLLFRILQGVGLGLFGPAMLGVAASFEDKSRAFALYRSAQAAGSIVAPLAGGYVGRLSLGYPFLASSAASALAMGAALPLQMKQPKRERRASFRSSMRALFSRRDFLALCLGSFLAELGYVALNVTLPLAGAERGLSTDAIGIVMAGYSLAFVLSQVPMGVLADRWQRRSLLVVCGGLAALAFGGLFLARQPWQMGTGTALLGTTLGTIFVQSGAWAAELAPSTQRSFYMAAFDSVIDLSFVVMPTLVGIMAEWQVQGPFLVCSLLLVASAAILAATPHPGLDGQVVRAASR